MDARDLVEAPGAPYPGRSSAESIRKERLFSQSPGALFQPDASREDASTTRPNDCRVEPPCPLDEIEPSNLGAGTGVGVGPAGAPPTGS